MLLQNELFLNIGTKDFPDGELRGHVTALPYSGHSARYDSECLSPPAPSVSPDLSSECLREGAREPEPHVPSSARALAGIERGGDA